MVKRFILKLINFRGFNQAAKKLYMDIKDFMSAGSIEDAKYIMKHAEELKQQVRPPIIFTFTVIGIAIGFFVIWGGLAPLDSATIARGSIVVSGNHKTIQHYEGGVIDKILVKDGQTVKAGDTLMVLNDTAAKARLQMTLGQYRAAKATEIRLLAQKYGDETMNFDDEIFDHSVPEVQKIIKTQESLFETQMKTLKGSIDVLNQKIAQYNEQIKGLESQMDSLNTQYRINAEQLKDLTQLHSKGFAKKTDVLAYQTRASELEERIASVRGNIASSKEAVSENQLQLLNIENEYHNKLNSELKEVQGQVLDLQEQYLAAKEVLYRTVVRSPVDGEITTLKYHTIGGVVGPGSVLMDIVPSDDVLIAEVKVDPKDIESIYAGLKAKVSLSAYKSRLVPRIDGEVIYVSADQVIDERQGPGGVGYYIAKVSIDQKDIDKINYDIQLFPGMPVEVFIVKGERTFLQYMLSPIVDSFHKAFKEK